MELRLLVLSRQFNSEEQEALAREQGACAVVLLKPGAPVLDLSGRSSTDPPGRSTPECEAGELVVCGQRVRLGRTDGQGENVIALDPDQAHVAALTIRGSCLTSRVAPWARWSLVTLRCPQARWSVRLPKTMFRSIPVSLGRTKQGFVIGEGAPVGNLVYVHGGLVLRVTTDNPVAIVTWDGPPMLYQVAHAGLVHFFNVGSCMTHLIRSTPGQEIAVRPRAQIVALSRFSTEPPIFPVVPDDGAVAVEYLASRS